MKQLLNKINKQIKTVRTELHSLVEEQAIGNDKLKAILKEVDKQEKDFLILKCFFEKD
jgi:regulator of replication initiation timing